MRLMKRILLGTACSLLFLMNHTEAQTMNNSTEALSPKERQIAAISAHTARGDMDGLKTALAAGLDAGLSLNEIREVLVQMYAYCGFPRSLNALSSLMELSKERAARGINDREGAEAGAPPAGRSIDFGTENQTKLCGAPVKGELFQFAPAIDEFLKAHLFGDIFGRDNLDWKTRELATIAALASMKGTESQLNSHIRIGKHNGLTDEQVDAILNISGSAGRDDPFPKGNPAPANFTGKAWVAMMVDNRDYDMSAYNVTFAPGTRNNWHSHSVGQVLFCTEGTGYYQERGRKARRLEPGSVVEIPANTEHWHGAAPDSEFVHIGITPKAASNKTIWGGPVTAKEYAEAAGGK